MKKIINVVEDEKDLNEVVRRYLENEGYQVNSYFTYQQAYDALKQPCDLWILDIMLGNDSGFDLIDEIKAFNPNTPVIFMSARDNKFDRVIGLEKGSEDYIIKPFSVKELVLRVSNIIRRVYSDLNHKISLFGYEIDEDSRYVYEKGQRIELTTKEFDLLMLFVKHRGIAFSRLQVLEKVWEEDFYGSDRVVDDTLRRLRKKMPNLNIQTIYGYGYRLS